MPGFLSNLTSGPSIPMVICAADGSTKMLHPGLPLTWGLLIFGSMALFSAWMLASPSRSSSSWHVGERSQTGLTDLPLLGALTRWTIGNPVFLTLLKLVTVAFFLLVIYAGLAGTPLAERNLATVLTWNLWWAGLIFSILLLGSAWCAVCPWDAIAQWMVRRRLWRRARPGTGLDLRVPRYLNNVWPALALFIGLTWLELGLGITTDPYATALVALLMVVLAAVSLALFRKKAFCHHFCPVGRTIGFYSQLAPVALRAVDGDVCSQCETLDCYHGNTEVDPCPTSLVMGTLTQNSYCTSCGNCVRACPHDNIAWRPRSPAIEAIEGARPRRDEAWFMLGLLALTALHGITMMPFWDEWMLQLARRIGDNAQLTASFTIGMVLTLAAVGLFYAAMVALTRRLSKTRLDYRRCFNMLAFTALPLAFSYHLAHNLNHLIRETAGIADVIANPLGLGTLPLSMEEKHQRYVDALLSPAVLHALQSGLMIAGFMIAVQTIRARGALLLREGNGGNLALSPMLLFALAMTGFHAWMLMQPMMMRM